MKIQYVKGDLLDANEIVILHGCNAQGVMGRGVAKAVKEQLPFAFNAYRTAYEAKGLVLGTVIWAFQVAPYHRIVGNMITQEYWQADRAVDGKNVDYDAVRACMKEVDRFMGMLQDGLIENLPAESLLQVALPKVGAGLGGGFWEDIYPMIEEESKCFWPVVYLKD